MRGNAILNGFPLRINVSLLAIAIVCAIIASLYDKETLRITCLVAGWALTLVSVGPSLFWYEWERVRKGKSEGVNPDTIIPGWKQFCESMGIDRKIEVKICPNLLNAYASHSAIEIGQPVLDNLNSISIKAVFAHELAHIKENHGLKRAWLLSGVSVGALVVAVVLFGVPYGCDLLGLSPFIFSVLLFSVGFAGIAMRFIFWPFEYKADLMADQRVQQNAVVSYLNSMAALRKMDVTRDFYGHPSVNKRKANLGWSRKTRFRKWYFEL